MNPLTLTRCKKSASAAAAWLGALLLLGGCASSAGLVPQGRLATPESLAAGKTLANTGPFARSWPAADWWHALGDAQLDALIGEALQGNPDLAAADARVRQASAGALSVDAVRAPSINASGSAQRIHIPGSLLSALGPARDVDATTWTATVNASYRPDLWGGERAAYEAALGQQRASEVEAQAARLALSADVARTYTRLVYAWQAHDLVQKDAERVQQLLKLTLQRVDAGIDGTLERRQAEALVAAARRQLAQTSQAIDSGRIALAVLIGKGPDRAAEITRPAVLQPLTLALPDNLPADLLGRRPDIVAARWRVEAAQRNADAAKAEFYPSINLSAAFGLLGAQAGDLTSLRNRYYTAAPALSLPLFDGGRRRATLAGRNAEYDIAVARYNKTLVGAFNDVALQIQTAQTLAAQEAAQQQSVAAAREAWDLAMLRYRRGVSGHIETLTAEQLVLGAETSLTAIRAQRADNAIQLVQALGGGYAPDNAATSTTQ